MNEEIEREIYNKIFCMIQERCEAEEVSEEMRLFEDLKFDSIIIIDLILEIETEFGISFQEYDKLFESVDNVQAFTTYFIDIIEAQGKNR